MTPRAEGPARFAYVELREHLRAQIIEGVYRPGQRLPTEHELAALTQLSRHTVRAALDELRLEGLITRRPGKGTFVSTTLPSAPRVRVIGGSAAVFGLGLSGRIMLVDPVRVASDDDDRRAAEELDVETSALRRVSFVRHVGNSPLGLWTIWVLADVFERIEASIPEMESNPDLSIMALIDRHADRVALRATLVMTAIAATAEVAEILQLEDGAPLFLVERTYYDAEDMPFEHVRVAYVPKHYAYRLELLGGSPRSAVRVDEATETAGDR
jgi:GntR family transcriptional regulator